MAARGGIKAAKAYAELYTDDTKLVMGLKAARVKLQAFGKQITALGTKLVKMAAIGAAPLALGTAAAAKFGEQMAMVSTMLDQPEQHMERFNKTIKEMSVEMGESTATLSKGLYDILSASIEPAKALDVLQVASKAAKAGLTDTGVAADAITTALNAYGYSADRAMEVSDVLFKTVKFGKTTFAELAPNIGRVISTAAAAGVSLEEMSAMVATLTRNGVQTAEAITAVNRTILGFMKPTEQAKAAAKDLGFDLNTATLGAKGLVGVFEILQGLDPEDIARVFPNVRAIKGVIPALRDLEGMSSNLIDMQNAAGSTEIQFDKMTDTMMHKFRQLKESVKIAGVEIGVALVDMMKDGAQSIIDGAKAIAEWVKENKGMIVTIAKTVLIVGGLGLALIVIGKVMASIAAIIGIAVGAVKLLNAAFWILSANPVVLILGAIAAAVGAIIFIVGKLASEEFIGLDAAEKRLKVQQGQAKAAEKHAMQAERVLKAEKGITQEKVKQEKATAKVGVKEAAQPFEKAMDNFSKTVKSFEDAQKREEKKEKPLEALEDQIDLIALKYGEYQSALKAEHALQMRNMREARAEAARLQIKRLTAADALTEAFGEEALTKEFREEQAKMLKSEQEATARRDEAQRKASIAMKEMKSSTEKFNEVIKKYPKLRAKAEAEQLKVEQKAAVKRAAEVLKREQRERQKALDEVMERTGFDQEIAALLLRYEKAIERGEKGVVGTTFQEFVKTVTEGRKSLVQGLTDWTTRVTRGGAYFGLGFGKGARSTEEHLNDIAENTAKLVDLERQRKPLLWSTV